MTDVLERPLDSRVSPCAILPCHADDQIGDDLHDPGPAGGSTLVRPLLGNQSPVPAKDGVGSDERCDFGESPSADRLAANGKPSPLGVSQSKSSSTELLLEDAVLFAEIVDDRILLAGDPTGHGGYEDLPGIEHRCHPVIVAGRVGHRSTAIDVMMSGLELPGFRLGRVFGQHGVTGSRGSGRS